MNKQKLHELIHSAREYLRSGGKESREFTDKKLSEADSILSDSIAMDELYKDELYRLDSEPTHQEVDTLFDTLQKGECNLSR
jgi:hypothetical protein|tara:strand:- start:1201 stop:1446 length:246 start_codon:yes stop_codon:yes gene_type:complete